MNASPHQVIKFTSRQPHAGDFVRVRSAEEILATLDKDGRLEGLPFMPEMFKYCGQTLRVTARAHKTCDVPSGTGRSMPDCVHLETRCDGSSHGGCQASCLLFWKTAWLRPVDDAQSQEPPGLAPIPSRCTMGDVQRATQRAARADNGQPIYSCQATCVTEFTKPMAWWEPRQYLEDYRSGNASLARIVRGLLFQAYQHGTQAWRRKVGIPARWLYDQLQKVIGGPPFPIRSGKLPRGTPAPLSDLNLQPGDLVRVKSLDAILGTISEGGMNRGLLFDKEMVPFCGKVFRVKERVSTFVNERTGELTTLKTPAVILEGVWCQSRYSNNKMFCPRSIYSWWREVWLERVEAGQ